MTEATSTTSRLSPTNLPEGAVNGTSAITSASDVNRIMQRVQELKKICQRDEQAILAALRARNDATSKNVLLWLAKGRQRRTEEMRFAVTFRGEVAEALTHMDVSGKDSELLFLCGLKLWEGEEPDNRAACHCFRLSDEPAAKLALALLVNPGQVDLDFWQDQADESPDNGAC